MGSFLLFGFTAILEVAGIGHVVEWILTAREEARSLAELLMGAAIVIAAAVPSLRLVAQSNTMSTTSRGDAIFNEAKQVREQLGFLSHVKSELDELFEFLRDFDKETQSKHIIVAFVDDLDRCLGGRNVKVLEAMQLVLNIPGAPVIAFLAIDSRIVVSSIEETFGEVFRGAYISGWEYLDKIVQLPFSIPPPTPDKLKKLVTSCLESGAAKPVTVAKRVKAVYDMIGKADGGPHVFMRFTNDAGAEPDPATQTSEYVCGRVFVEAMSPHVHNTSSSPPEVVVQEAARLLTASTKTAEQLCEKLGEEGLEITWRALNTAFEQLELQSLSNIDGVVRQLHKTLQEKKAAAESGVPLIMRFADLKGARSFHEM